MKEQIINNSVVTDNFSRAYPTINKYISENGEYLKSRNGPTKEILNFKTEIVNPYKRLCGNNGRDVNVFFLLAEALWIFKGEKDVETLEIFNSQMSNYSDDGKVFHAPYGFRLRNYGVSSLDNFKSTEENKHHASIMGVDQVLIALKMLSEDSSDRRVVMSIWNPDLDLNTKSKDIPCNDMVMLKVRNGKLHTTIANRSNDLHWGLTTNVFQFSFVTEIMSNILGIKLGTQTHNSQSLHIYTENPIHEQLYDSMLFNNGNFDDIYDISSVCHMDMNFSSNDIDGKLCEVDLHIGRILESVRKKERMSDASLMELSMFSKYLVIVHDLLHIYIWYSLSGRNDKTRSVCIEEILSLRDMVGNIDIVNMSLNFFAKRMKLESSKQSLGSPLGFL